MYTLLKKEINSFFSSVIGYVVIVVFLLTISLFLWVFSDSGFHIPDSGYANIDSLFIVTPWVYMFLVPAITMRLFAEERKSGTIELLLTRPLTELQIILAKYFAGVVLVVISLIPTILYFITVFYAAAPRGNVDTGAVMGSYAGLVFLGAGFVSIGVFASSLSDNQVVAFIIALFLCFICYAGFESLSGMAELGKLNNLIYLMGINAHYASMSRGVIDTRDVLYFLSLISLFILLTRTVLESRKW